MEHSMNLVNNDFQISTIFEKRFILDVWEGSENVSVVLTQDQEHVLPTLKTKDIFSATEAIAQRCLIKKMLLNIL